MGGRREVHIAACIAHFLQPRSFTIGENLKNLRQVLNQTAAHRKKTNKPKKQHFIGKRQTLAERSPNRKHKTWQTFSEKYFRLT